MNTPAVPASVHAPLSSGTAGLDGMAALGKVAFALLVIMAVIFACVWLLRRFGMGRGAPGRHLKVVAGRALGHREKVVIIEVEDTWLVLGVTPGQVNKLHELPARSAPATPPPPTPEGGTGFAKRFAEALRQNMQRGRS